MARDTSVKLVAVSVDTAEPAQDRVAWAASLAAAFGAQLTGVAAAQPYIPVYTPFGVEFVNLQPALLEAANKQTEAWLKSAEAIFRAGCQGTDGAWKCSSRMPGLDFLNLEARSNDLIVLGRQGAKDASDPLGVWAGDVILTLGRPVVVVPPGSTRFLGSRVVIAWKDAREARRAVADALPYLTGADEILVCAVSDESATLDSLTKVVAYLEAHGHAAKALVEPRHRRSDADALLDVVRRVDATLIVAGAYGQSRLKEWAFGGLTRELLDHAPVPCLMSH